MPTLMQELPILPLRDVVVFPHMVIPLFVGRLPSIHALEAAVSRDKRVLLLTQRNPKEDNPSPKDMYTIGTEATILQLLKLPDNTVKLLVEGLSRAQVQRFVPRDQYFVADATIIETDIPDTHEIEVLHHSVLSAFEQYVKLNKKIPMELIASLTNIDDPARRGDLIAAHLALKVEQKQELLELIELQPRLEKLLSFMEDGVDVMQVEKRIRNRVKRQVEKTQREYYLNEQMKAIQLEIGELKNLPDEAENYLKKIEAAKMPKDVKEKAMAELNKLKLMSPMSAEATVSRSYLDWVVNLPWSKSKRTKECHDLKQAEDILEAEHYGLEKVKERILEYLAVQQVAGKIKGPILCLVGPPGVGKTSLGESIARATNRKYVRMALGGVHDEAEIRGHRRTYIGSMPGKLIQKISKVGVRNPLFLLDEVDKISKDFRGDPASALLEVLDPEQNSTFNDHYLEVDFDLSDVMFVATANTLDIPPPLLDRMEVIRLAGYTEDEKIHIATRHLVPKQLNMNGLKSSQVKLTNEAIRDIIRHYTREAGVRNLEREISKVFRKLVRIILKDKPEKIITVDAADLEKYLGVIHYRYGLAEEHDRVGLVTGLAWTEVGGELLTIEAAAVEGKGKLSYTGQLGTVMQESIQAAMMVVRNRAQLLGLVHDFYEKQDIHIHVPEGAIPKDGPSAGIGMCTALVSVLSGIPVHADVAMTGEITLRGEVLPIGGLKEKLLAAHRGGIRTVIIPEENRRDLKEIPDNIKENLDIKPVQWIDEVLAIALQRMPENSGVEIAPTELPNTKQGTLVVDKKQNKKAKLPRKANMAVPPESNQIRSE